MPVFKFSFRSLLVLILSLTIITAGCDANVQAPPPITVVITAVNDQQALDDAVNAALTATAQENTYATETQLARAAISLTPSITPTITPTLAPPTATPFLSPTPTSTATETLTPTLAPLASNTPSMVDTDTNGRIRFLHVWRPDINALPIDILIEDTPVVRDFQLGASTGYQSVAAGTIRVSVVQSVTAEALANPNPSNLPVPILTQAIDVPRGGSLSIALADLGDGLTLVPITEDVSPLSTGETRLNILQANANLLRSNVSTSDTGMTLVSNIALGDTPGPFDFAAGQLSLQLFDADSPSQLIANLQPFTVSPHVNYLLVFLPPARDDQSSQVTDFLLFEGSVGMTESEVGVRYLNAAISAGPVRVFLNGEILVNELQVGQATVTLPSSTLGNQLSIVSLAGAEVYSGSLGPWQNAEQSKSPKIVLITDAPATQGSPVRVEPITFFEGTPPSLTRSNVRLIHGLTGVTRTLDLEIRSTNPTIITNAVGVPQSQQGDTTWSPVVQNIGFGTASNYTVRTPNLFDVRLVLSGSSTAQAQIPTLQLLPGGVYDFVALPGGSAQGVARLLLLQPEVQVSVFGVNQSDPAVVQEQVEAILTASAPAVTVTPTSFSTATATISPVPTNTPQGTNTPNIPDPVIVVNPKPPNTAVGALILRAQNFSPQRRYTVRLDNEPENISGSINDDGTLLLTVPIPANFEPGTHTVRICVDCRPGGMQQEGAAVFYVADPNRTATPTPDR